MNKQFIIIVILVVVGLFGLYSLTKTDRPEPKIEQLGEKHQEQGRQHIQVGASHEPFNSDLPSSGPHYTEPSPWGVFDKTIEDETFVHNLEHGGIVIAYRPDLPPDQIEKLKSLFGPPFSRENFTPNKALVFPRKANSKPIQIASWARTLNLNSFNEQTLVSFYTNNIGKSPEPTAP